MSEPPSSAPGHATSGHATSGHATSGQQTFAPYGPGGYRGPAAPLTPAEQRTWAMVAHLSHLAGSLVGLPFLGPLVVYLLVKDRGPFARRQAAEALNFQILLCAIYVAAVVLSVVTLGLGALVSTPVAAVAALAGLVLTIIAAVQSSQGVEYRYPFSWRLVS